MKIFDILMKTWFFSRHLRLKVEFHKLWGLILILFTNRSHYLKDLSLWIDWNLVSCVIGIGKINNLCPSLKTCLIYTGDIVISLLLPTQHAHDPLYNFFISYEILHCKPISIPGDQWSFRKHLSKLKKCCK